MSLVTYTQNLQLILVPLKNISSHWTFSSFCNISSTNLNIYFLGILWEKVTQNCAWLWGRNPISSLYICIQRTLLWYSEIKCFLSPWFYSFKSSIVGFNFNMCPVSGLFLENIREHIASWSLRNAADRLGKESIGQERSLRIQGNSGGAAKTDFLGVHGRDVQIWSCDQKYHMVSDWIRIGSYLPIRTQIYSTCFYLLFNIIFLFSFWYAICRC